MLKRVSDVVSSTICVIASHAQPPAVCAGLRPTANSTLAAAIHGHIGRVLASTPFTISQSEGGGGARLAIVNGIAQTCGVVKLSKKNYKIGRLAENVKKHVLLQS